jgi:hypothetical protein
LLLGAVVEVDFMAVVEALVGIEPVGHHQQEHHLQKHLGEALHLNLLYL